MPKVLHASYSGYFPGCLNSVSSLSDDQSPMSLQNAMDFYWRITHWDVKIIPDFQPVDRSQPSYVFENVPVKHKKRGTEWNPDNFNIISNPEEIVCTDGCRIAGITETQPPFFYGYSFDIQMSNYDEVLPSVETGFGSFIETPLLSFLPNFYGSTNWFYFTGGFPGLLRKGPPGLDTIVGDIKIFFGENNVYTSPLWGYSSEVNPFGDKIYSELYPKAYRSFE